MVTSILSALLLASYAAGGDLPPIAETVRGSHNFGDNAKHVMIYGDYENKFVWGIVFPRDTLASISSTMVPEPTTTIELQSGITLAFVKNEVTISQGSRNLKMALKPQTIYLMQDDFSIKSSEDVSGFRLVPKKRWNRYVDQYITTHDLVVPNSLSMRFGKQAF